MHAPADRCPHRAQRGAASSARLHHAQWLQPALQQPIALSMLARGTQRLGERLRVWHLGQEIAAKVVKTSFFDAARERLHG